MSRDSRRAPAHRCLLVWAAVTAVTAALLTLLRQELVAARDAVIAPPGTPAFDAVLASVATLVLGVSATWLWCLTTTTTLEALRGVRQVELPGARGAVRRLVLGACGVALVATVAPAQADDVRGAAGQPPQPLERTATAAVPAAHPVARGESLWEISEERLRASGAMPTDAEVDHAWRALWQANDDLVGDDPDVIVPGQRLDVPETLR
jgi:LysM domain